jgi:hypothetical protein
MAEKDKKPVKKEKNWTVVGFGVNYQGHKSKKAAMACAREKGIPKENVRRLKDL